MSRANQRRMRDDRGEFGFINVHLFDIFPAVSSRKGKVGFFTVWSVVITERWFCQVEAIMNQYSAVLQARTNEHCPQQILLFSSRWAESLRTFAATYMCSPCFVIASPIDISYYGRVRQVLAVYLARNVSPYQDWIEE